MTTRSGPEIDPGPVPAERFSRASRIAAIHAYADWLAANPGVPMPQQLMGRSQPEGSSIVQRDILEGFAHTFAISVYHGPDDDYALLWVKRENGIEISHSVRVPTRDGAV